jgi:inosine-uridine nucleoside N-ribohydrolase
LLLLIVPSSTWAKPRALVITTDCGADMDDQWAIAHASLAPELKLLAVIGNFAPEPHNLVSGQTTDCARRVLKVVGRARGIRLYRGADRALPNGAVPARNEGVGAILRLARNHSRQNRLIVLGMGPVTDIASALLIEPRLADRIEVVALAFDRYPEGGDGWNVRNDIRAWRILLDSRTPITVASGTVALRYLALTRSEAKSMMRALGSPGKYLATLHAAWLEKYGAVFALEIGGKDRWPIWDEALIAVLLGFSQAEKRPRPLLNSDASFSFPNRAGNAPFNWVIAIDRTRLYGHLRRQLNRSQQ